jgi:adenylate kinase
MSPKHLFFLVGRPSSGKETQSTRLAEALRYRVFMTGKRFRDIIASGSQLGMRIKSDYEKGNLMPTWVADYMLEDFIFSLPIKEGAVFEGSGRDEEQAKTIEKVCAWLGRGYTVFNLEVGEDEVVRRALARKRDATDSDESVVRNRMREYDRATAPAIVYFRSLGRLIDIDGTKTPDEVTAAIMTSVKKLGL